MAEQELGRQTSMQSGINDLLRERSKLMEEQEKILSRQADIAKSLREALSDPKSSNQNMAINDLNASLDQTAKSLTKTKKTAGDMWKEFKQKTKDAWNATKQFFAMPGLFSVIFKSIGSVVGTMKNLAMAVLSIPFKMFDAFVDLANKIEFNPAIFMAIQEVKEAFGDLAYGPARAVYKNLSTIRQESGNLAQTGLSVARVFGAGPDGIAEALKAVNELAIQLGASFYNLQGTIQKNGIQMVMMSKGLGLSAEQMAQQLKFSQAMGKDPVKAQFEFANAALQTAKTFGMSAKMISRGMNDLINQFPQLGKQGPKALAPIVAYAQKLGIEIKDMTGAFEKFSSFESAADSASQLSQAFGVNIDAMRIMSEENPAKKMEMLRQAFQAAGKDATHMGVAERKLAEQLTGVSGAAFDAAFGLGNQKVKLAETEKQTQQALKTQMSQIQVMKELGKAIKLAQPLQPKEFQGPLDALIQGFELGIRRAHESRMALVNFRASMMTLYWLGRDLGIMFVKYFPGVKEIFGAIAKFFSPGRFGAFSREARVAFKILFEDPVNNFDKFMNLLKKMIDKNFGSGAGGVLDLMKKGLGSFTKAMGGMLGKALEVIIGLITDGINSLADIVTGKKKVKMPGMSEAAEFTENLFGPIGKAIEKAGPQLMLAIERFFDLGIAKLKAWWDTKGSQEVKAFLQENWWTIAKWLMILNPAQTASLAMSVGGGLISIGKAAAKYAAARAAAQAGASAAASAAAGAATSGAAGAAAGAGAQAGASAGAGAAAGFAARFLPTFTRGATQAAARLGASAGTKAPIIGAVLAAGLGAYSAYKFGDSPEDKKLLAGAKAGADDRAYAAFMTIADSVSFGLASKARAAVRGDDKEEALKIYAEREQSTMNRMKEIQEKTASELDEFLETTNSYYKRAVEKGDADLAASYMADQAVKRAEAEGRLKLSDADYIKNMREIRNAARAEAMPRIEKEIKDAEKQAARHIKEENDAKKLAKIEKAKSLAEQVKDIGDLQKQIDEGILKLDRSIGKGDLEKKINNFSEKIMKVYPAIESAAKKILDAKDKTMEIQEGADPVGMLVGVFKNIISLGVQIKGANEVLTETNLKSIKNVIERIFGKASMSDPNAIISILQVAQGVNLDVASFENLSDAFKSVKSGVESAVETQRLIGEATFFPIKNFLTTGIELMTSDIVKSVAKIPSLEPFSASFESIAEATNHIKTMESNIGKKSVDSIVDFITRMNSSVESISVLDISKLLVIAKAVTNVSESVVTAGTTFKNVAEVVKTTKEWRGGHVEVSHNIPRVKMEVNVHLDAKQFARSMVEVNIAKDQTQPKRIDFSVHTDKVNYGD